MMCVRNMTFHQDTLCFQFFVLCVEKKGGEDSVVSSVWTIIRSNNSWRSGIIIFDLVFPLFSNFSLQFPLKSSSSCLHLLPGLPGLLCPYWRINTCQLLRPFNHYNYYCIHELNAASAFHKLRMLVTSYPFNLGAAMLDNQLTDEGVSFVMSMFLQQWYGFHLCSDLIPWNSPNTNSTVV